MNTLIRLTARRRLLHVLGALLLTAAQHSARGQAPAGELADRSSPPNFVLILADDK